MCTLTIDEYRAESSRAGFIAHAREHLPRSGRFKIGITCNPRSRKSGYNGDYDEMVVLYQSHKWMEIQMLERDLIQTLEQSDNRNPGGEGRKGSPPYFLYMVKASGGSRPNRRESKFDEGTWQLVAMLQERRMAEKRRREAEEERAAQELLGILAGLEAATGQTSQQEYDWSDPPSVSTQPSPQTESPASNNGFAGWCANDASGERAVWTITPLTGHGLEEHKVRARSMGNIIKYLSCKRCVAMQYIETDIRGHLLYVTMTTSDLHEVYVVSRCS